MTVSALLFDLDGTLFDRERCVRELVLAQQRHFAAELTGIAAEAYIARVLALDAHGYGDKPTLYRQIVAEAGLPAALSATLVEDFRARYQTAGALFPDVLPALETLRRAGFKLAIISNGATTVQLNKIERLGLAERFDAVLISEREGIRKPAREIFERALRRLDVSAAQAWHVGDHPDTDVAAAVDAGLTAVWRRTPYWNAPTLPHHAVDSLHELFALM